MTEKIQEFCNLATVSGEQVLPTCRDMAERHNLSLTMVRKVVKQMERDGFVYTVKGSGTFVRPRSKAVEEYFLFLMDSQPGARQKGSSMEDGFTARIAELGGASVSLPLDAVLRVPGGNSIVVLGCQDGVARARFLEKLGPCLRVVLCGGEAAALGHVIFVGDFPVEERSGLAHAPDGINAPVQKYSEFSFVELRLHYCVMVSLQRRRPGGSLPPEP